jgi:uncharacterized membrane protein YdjX (TVP38/TMEM64 family)
MSAKLVIRGSALFVSLAAIGLALKAAGLIDVIDEAWVDATIRGRGLSGYLIFLAVGWGLTSVGLPRQLVAFLAGYAFGFVLGTGLSLAATVMGCVTAFTFARLVGRDLVARRISGRIKRVENFLSDNPFSMTLLIRFLPLGSNFLTNLAAGVSGVRALPFFSGSALGYIPQMMVFALVGSGITLEPGHRISLSAVLFLVSGAIGIALYRKYRHGKSFDNDLERQLEGGGE